MAGVISEYASMNDARLRQEWQLSLSSQVLTWRERARDVLGASAPIGTAVGGAAATAAGAAYAVAQGFVQGATSVTSGGQAQANNPPPLPDLNPTRTLAIRRSNSIGDLQASQAAPCPKCDLGQTRAAHT